MANKRILKRKINYVCSELFSEVEEMEKEDESGNDDTSTLSNDEESEPTDKEDNEVLDS